MSTTLSISQLITLFLADQDVCELSLGVYERELKQFFYWVHRNKIDYQVLRRADIIRYKSDLIKTKSPATVDGYLTVVRKFYRWASLNGHFENIAEGIKSPRRRREYSKQILSIDQVNRLLNHIDRSTPGGKRDYAIISLLVGRGLRTIELHRANVGDLSEISGIKVLWIQRKNHITKDEYAELDDNLYDVIEEYLMTRENLQDDEPLFTSLAYRNYNKRITTRTYSKMAKKYLKAIGATGKEYTAHSLRHTAAATLIAQGLSIYDVQLYLGHTSPHVTEIYTRMVEQQQRLNNSPVKVLSKLFNISENKRGGHEGSTIYRTNSNELNHRSISNE